MIDNMALSALSSAPMRSFLRKNLVRFSVLYVVLLVLGELLFVAWMYNTGSTTVDYAHARMESADRVRTGIWSQVQADTWLYQHSQLFWREVWDRSKVYLLLALVLLFGRVMFARILAVLRRSRV